MTFFESLQELYTQELYDEVAFLDELVPDKFRGISSAKNELLVRIYLAETYNQLGKFNLSAKHYRIVLENYKQGCRGITSPAFSEIEIRYKYHIVLVKIRRFEDAIKVLQAIPEHESPAKIKVALVKLLISRDNSETGSVDLHIFEDIVKACPSALMSTTFLIRHGKLTAESASIPKPLRNINTVKNYLAAQDLLAQNSKQAAAELLIGAKEASFRMLVEAGSYLYQMGRYVCARIALLRAHDMKPNGTSFMDLLALLLYDAEEFINLENLYRDLIHNAPESSEAVVAFGYTTRRLGSSHLSKALHIAQKACMLTPYGTKPSTQSLIFKSRILIDTERYHEALKHLHEAIKNDPSDYELNKLLVTCYLEKSNIREARCIINRFSGSVPGDRRVSILKAHVFLKVGNTAAKTEAIRVLEQAVAESPFLLEAVWLLVDLYDKGSKYERGQEMLKKLLTFSHSKDVIARIHHQIGDFFQKSQQPGAAYEHVNIALSHGREEAAAEISNLDVAMYQTPSPLATRSMLPPAPRRHRPTRQNNEMDSSADLNTSADSR